MSIEATLYQTVPMFSPDGKSLNMRPDAVDRKAREVGAFLGSVGGLRIYFPTRPYLPLTTGADVNRDDVQLMVAIGPYDMVNYEKLSRPDMVRAGKIALELAETGYIVGSNRDKGIVGSNRDKGDDSPNSQSWGGMFHMQALKCEFPKPTPVLQIKQPPFDKLREPFPKQLRAATRSFLGMFHNLSVSDETQMDNLNITNGAVAKLQKDIRPEQFAELLMNIDNQLSSLWHKLGRKSGKVHRHNQRNETVTPIEEYLLSISRFRQFTGNKHHTRAVSYSWSLFKHQDALMLALGPHILSSGGFLELVGIVPVRSQDSKYDFGPDIERSRKAVAAFSDQWGLKTPYNKSNGGFHNPIK